MNSETLLIVCLSFSAISGWMLWVWAHIGWRAALRGWKESVAGWKETVQAWEQCSHTKGCPRKKKEES